MFGCHQTKQVVKRLDFFLTRILNGIFYSFMQLVFYFTINISIQKKGQADDDDIIQQIFYKSKAKPTLTCNHMW